MSDSINKPQPPDTLDLVILDSGAPKRAVIFARSGSNVAVARLSYKKEIQDLQKARQWIEDSMFGKALQKPKARELADFGNRLFRLIIRDKVKTLYNHLPPSHVRSDEAQQRQAMLLGLAFNIYRL
jgi:hypothetical protein